MEDPDIGQAKPRLKEHADLKSLIDYIVKKLIKATVENPDLPIDVSSLEFLSLAN